MAKDLAPIVNFLFEVGMLAHTPRSGFFFLGSGDQSVAEHTNRVAYIGYVLAMMENKNINMAKVLQMCLFHDIAEVRTSDPNYVHQKYLEVHEDKAHEDLASTLEFGDELRKIFQEYKERKSREALIAKDADVLEWLLTLKEQYDTGNTRAKSWLPSAIKRLKTPSAKKLAHQIVKTDSDRWWFGNKEDEWWVSRNRNK